jgi:hypothetical protein
MRMPVPTATREPRFGSEVDASAFSEDGPTAGVGESDDAEALDVACGGSALGS